MGSEKNNAAAIHKQQSPWDPDRATRAASLPRHELMIGALGDVIPRADQRLELGVRGVDLPRHRRLLRLLPDHLTGQLPKVAQHRRRELDDLDLALELRLEAFQRDRVLGVKISEAVELD